MGGSLGTQRRSKGSCLHDFWGIENCYCITQAQWSDLYATHIYGNSHTSLTLSKSRGHDWYLFSQDTWGQPEGLIKSRWSTPNLTSPYLYLSLTQLGGFTSGPAHCKSVPDVTLEADGVAYDTDNTQQTSNRHPPHPTPPTLSQKSLLTFRHQLCEQLHYPCKMTHYLSPLLTVRRISGTIYTVEAINE